MGISAGGSSGGPKADINVTPLVDIVLVLLIIFMVSMPLLMRNITLEIPPKADPNEVIVNTDTMLKICGRVDGTIVFHDGTTDRSINRNELAATLRPLLEKKLEKVVWIDFEDGVVWTDAVSVTDTIHGLGSIVEEKTGERDVRIALQTREGTAANAGGSPCDPAQ